MSPPGSPNSIPNLTHFGRSRYTILTHVAETEPANRCPYPKPFPDSFRECPAYQPVRFIPLDTRHRPLRPVWSCAHLEVAYASEQPYTSCRLGTRADRVDWARRVRADRLESWRAIAREFGEALKESLASLYAAKAAQLEAQGTPGSRDAERALRDAADRFLDLDFALIDRRAAELAEIGFPVDAMKIVTRDALQALTQRPAVYGSYTPPAELLAPFSDDIRDFVRGLFESPATG